MADKPLPEKRVAVITGDGKFGTISERHAEEIVKSGGRVLGAKEAAEKQLQAEYDSKSVGQKMVGAALVGGAALSPELAAFQQGGRAGLTAGLEEVAAAKLGGAIGETVLSTPGVGQKMAAQAQQIKEASPTAYGAGEVAGMVGGALASGGAGAAGAAAKALPGVGIGALGGLAEAGAARATAGLAAKGMLGRAAATGISLGARGAVEGGLYAGTQAAADQILADPDLSAQKLFTADGLTAVGKSAGIGAVTGLAGGAALGGAGSLAASGSRKAFGGLARVMSKGEQAATDVAAAERTAMLPPEPRPATPRGAPDAAMRSTGAQVDDEAGAAAAKILGDVPADAWGGLQSGSNGYKPRLDRFVEDGGKLEMYGDIRAPDGGFAGEFGSTFSRDKGRLVAKTDNLLMEAAHQGKGAGAELARNLEETYRKLGVEEVRLDASQVGRYTWAKAGYEWNEATGQKMAKTFEKWLAGKGLPTSEAEAALQGAKALAESPNGKAFLLSDAAPNWHGTKVLTPAVEAAQPLMGTLEREAVAGAAQAEKGFLAQAGSREGLQGLAHDRAWGALGSGFGLQSTEFAKRAARYLPGGTRDVGEWVMRKGIIDPKASMLDLAKAATPEKMLPAIRAANEVTGARLGEITGASGGQVQAMKVLEAMRDVVKPYSESAATRPIANNVAKFAESLAESLKISTGEERIAVQDLLRERKALDLMVFENAAFDPNITVQVKRELRGKLEGLVVEALDESSGRLKGDLAKEYKALKKDYLAGMIAEEAAEDSAARAAKAGFLGLKDLTFGGGSILKSVGSKLFRERGDAVAAGLLYREAERGAVAKWVQKTDDQIGKAAKGLLNGPAKGVPKTADKMPPTRALSRTALAKVAEFNADPESFLDRVAAQHESLATHSPEIAEALTAKHVQAMTFMASKVPVAPDPDPFDPHPAPKLTPGEQSELGRYWWYAEKPSRFYAEVARGKITYEGAETAQALTPGPFEELQMRTAEALTERLAKGEKIPFRQRQILGVLLDFAATPSQRPEHARFLQQNAQIPEPPPPPAPRRSAPSPSQRTSSYDRLESDGPGRR